MAPWEKPLCPLSLTSIDTNSSLSKISKPKSVRLVVLVKHVRWCFFFCFGKKSLSLSVCFCVSHSLLFPPSLPLSVPLLFWFPLSLCHCPLAVPSLQQDRTGMATLSALSCSPCSCRNREWPQQQVTHWPRSRLATGHLELLVGRRSSHLGLGCPAGGPCRWQPRPDGS